MIIIPATTVTGAKIRLNFSHNKINELRPSLTGLQKTKTQTEVLSPMIFWGFYFCFCSKNHTFRRCRTLSRKWTFCSIDFLQLIKPNNSDYVSKGNQVIEKLKLRSFNFEKWIEASNRPTMKYRQLRNWCGSNSWKWHRNWRVGDCVEEFSRWKVENYSLPTKYK